VAELALIYDPRFLEHETGYHPERPERLLWALEKVTQLGLDRYCQLLAPRLATEEELVLIHDRVYINQVKAFASAGGGYLSLDTPGSARTYETALLSVGAVLRGIEVTVTGQFPAAFCLVRPPGHHAQRSVGKGFCFFNNVAVGARWAQQRYRCQRVAIVDLDVHHGDGTQEAFYSDPSVLYASIHQYPFYPYTGAKEEMGAGAGAGYTVNIPLPHGGSDEEYLLAVERVILPVTRSFRPQLILVSAGFDAHFADQLGDMNVSAAGFYRLTGELKALSELSHVPLVLALEGGYSQQGMSWGTAATVAALVGAPRPGEACASQEPFAPDRTGVRPEVRVLLESIADHRKI